MKRAACLLLGLLALTAPGSAQNSADPAALTSLRQRYQTLLQEVEVSARARWLAGMEALEQQQAAAGDFAAAAALRHYRLRLQTPPPGAEAAVAPITLRASGASGGTGIDAMDARKDVVRFRRTGAMLEWELPGQLPGSYQVSVTFSVIGEGDWNDQPDPLRDPAVPLPLRSPGSVRETDAGGVLEFRKITSLKEGGDLLRRSVRSTGGWALTRSADLGTVTLDNKIVKFSLKAVDALPAGCMDFHRIDLVPVERPAGEGQASAELLRLKEVYQKQFTGQTRLLNAKYWKSLGELEVAAGKLADNETLALVRQERKRITGGMSTPEGPDTTAAASAVQLLPVTEKLYMMVRGEAKLTNQGDYLTRLRPANTCQVIWKLAGLGIPSGTYEVEVDCRFSPSHGGTATLEAGAPGSPPGPPLTFSVGLPIAPEAMPEAKKEMVVHSLKPGKLIIPKGSPYLTLRVDSLHFPNSFLCELKGLRLTPVAP